MAGAPPTSMPSATRHRSRRVVDAMAVVVAVGLVACVALAISGESSRAFSGRGGVITFFGRLFGLTGTYLLLVMVLLISRIPFVEKAVGQDRLVKWHRNLGQWPVYLLVLHAVFITVGYAQTDHEGNLHQAWLLLDSYPDVLMAATGLGLVILAAALSIRQARRRMRYETWWTIHLYLYLALALSFSHQIANGAAFVGHPMTRYIWATFWGVTTGTVLICRVVLPIARTMWHGLKVVEVREESPGVVSVICSGRHVERLGAVGGQFFQWRFMRWGLWWQAHPYSLSAVPRPPHVRLTVRTVGDHSEALAGIPIGTRVAIEGPYGAFTDAARTGNRVLLVGAGVGVTPIRALLEDMDPAVGVTVITRSSTIADSVLSHEIRDLIERRGGKLHELVGARAQFPLDAAHLKRLVPDVAKRDVYVCGPEGFNTTVTEAALEMGVSQEKIHCEQFAF